MPKKNWIKGAAADKVSSAEARAGQNAPGKEGKAARLALALKGEGRAKPHTESSRKKARYGK